MFTTHFPFGRDEVFLETEIAFLSKHFSRVTIIPLFISEFAVSRRIPDNTVIHDPLISCRIDNKLRLFIKGLLNTAPLLFAIKELVRKQVFRNDRWILNWLSYTCITRAALSSPDLKSLIEQTGYRDLLYFYWGDNSANMVPFIRRMTANKIIVRFHGGDLYEERKGNYLPYRYDLLKNIDLAVFISNHGRMYLEKRYPGILKQSVVSRLGVTDHGLAGPGSGKTLFIVSCSSIVRIKRVHLIAAALNYLDFKVKWTHFGTGPLMKELRRAVNLLPGNISVCLKGHVDNRDVMKYYMTREVDLFINVSGSEGLPVSIMEAISMGIPVLATDTGGVSEIVSEKNGYLTGIDSSSEQIAGYIRHFYERDDKAILREHSRKMWQDRFDAEKNFNDFCKILTS